MDSTTTSPSLSSTIETDKQRFQRRAPHEYSLCSSSLFASSDNIDTDAYSVDPVPLVAAAAAAAAVEVDADVNVVPCESENPHKDEPQLFRFEKWINIVLYFSLFKSNELGMSEDHSCCLILCKVKAKKLSRNLGLGVNVFQLTFKWSRIIFMSSITHKFLLVVFDN